MVDLIEEECVDLGRVVDQHHVDLAAEQLGNRVQPFVGRGLDVFQQLLGRQRIELFKVDVIDADFQ